MKGMKEMPSKKESTKLKSKKTPKRKLKLPQINSKYTKVLLIVITAIISSIITIICYGAIYQSTMCLDSGIVGHTGVTNLKKIKYNFPAFSITSIGLLNGPITNESIKDIQTYEITAIVSDSIYRHQYTYKGVKLKDVLENEKLKDYKKIIFKSNGGLQVEYTKEEIDDNVFIVFEKDGIEYPKLEKVSLLNPTVYDRYNITNVLVMEIS